MKHAPKLSSIEYRFSFADGTQDTFLLQFDEENLTLLLEDLPDPLPKWAELCFYQCPNCPLLPAESPYCPFAARIANIVRRFDKFMSYDKVHMTVVTRERTISQDTSAQQGVSSLLGLVIANSGCPHTAFFRPMAHFHQPLANVEETIFRAASMYLLSQYFAKQEGRKASLELDGLEEIYQNIHVVNIAMANRLRAAGSSDLPANAVILLDLYALDFPHRIEKILEGLRHLFTPFLEQVEPKARPK